MHNSSSGAGLVKITGFDPNMNVRAFLVKLLPEIDGPSVHAVDIAFKEDGVETMRELLSYLEGGVLEIKDLKNYSKQWELDMSHTLKLSRAVEHLLEERVKTVKHDHVVVETYHSGDLSGFFSSPLFRTSESRIN